MVRKHGGVIDRLSLEHKLPLIIGGLLLAVIAALTTAAYVEVRTTSFGIASERLTNVTLQFRDLFQQSGAQLRTQIAATANKLTVADFAKAKTRTTCVPRSFIVVRARNARISTGALLTFFVSFLA